MCNLVCEARGCVCALLSVEVQWCIVDSREILCISRSRNRCGWLFRCSDACSCAAGHYLFFVLDIGPSKELFREIPPFLWNRSHSELPVSDR